MSKTAIERDALIEKVETAMIRGAHRPADILRAVPEIKRHETASEYMEIVGNRWSGRQSDNEEERQRLISEKREVIREAYLIIEDADKTLETVARFCPEPDAKKSSQEQMAAQEVIAAGAYANKAKALKLILDAHSGIAKLKGLEVKKIEHSGSITEERNATIEILTTRAEAHSIRGVLRSLNPAVQTWDGEVPAQHDAVALPSGESRSSE